MAPPEGLRHTGEWRLIWLTPNVCLTPIGSGTPPVPYFCFESGAQSQQVEQTVRFGRCPAFTLASSLSTTQNDAAGCCGGVMSGTFGAQCVPIECVESVSAGKSPVIRHGQLFWMNDRNCLALAYFDESPSIPGQQTGYSQDPQCAANGGEPMTQEEYAKLQTPEGERAMVQDGYDPRGMDVECEDPGSPWSPQTPSPDANACPWRHCRNECLTERYGASGYPGTPHFQATVGGHMIEAAQTAEAIATGGHSPATFSAYQTHDPRCSNALGREVATNADVESGISENPGADFSQLSCEQACAVELGGFKVKHVPEREPSPIYSAIERYRKYREALEKLASDARDAAADTIAEAAESAVEQVLDAAKKSITEKVGELFRGIPTLR
jgi:hypothetical protein